MSQLPTAPAAHPSRDDGSDDPEARARALRDAAEAEARALIEEAREQVRDLVKRSEEQGKSEGFAQAEHMREQIAVLQQRMVQEVEGEVVRTAMKVAGELLAAELTQRPEAIVDLVHTALRSARDARDVFLRVHPRDAEVLRRHKSRLIDALGRAKEVDVRVDRNVAPGGVLIQTESGVIDAQLDTQLDEIARALGA